MVAGCGRVMDYYLSGSIPFLGILSSDEKGEHLSHFGKFITDSFRICTELCHPGGIDGREPYRIMELTLCWGQ